MNTTAAGRVRPDSKNRIVRTADLKYGAIDSDLGIYDVTHYTTDKPAFPMPGGSMLVGIRVGGARKATAARVGIRPLRP